MSPTKVLITGAGGLIGSYLVKDLVNNGVSVVALGVLPLSASDRHPNIEVIEHRFEESTKSLDPILKGINEIQFVIHCGGLARDSKCWVDHEISNIKFTEALLAWSIKSKVKKFIYISTCLVLSRPSSFYALSKSIAEGRVLAKIKSFESVVILRLAPVVSLRSRSLYGLLLRIASQKIPLPVKNLKAKKHWVDLRLIGEVIRGITEGVIRQGVYTVANNRRFSISELCFISYQRAGSRETGGQFIIPNWMWKLIFLILGRVELFEELHAETTYLVSDEIMRMQVADRQLELD